MHANDEACNIYQQKEHNIEAAGRVKAVVVVAEMAMVVAEMAMVAGEVVARKVAPARKAAETAEESV